MKVAAFAAEVALSAASAASSHHRRLHHFAVDRVVVASRNAVKVGAVEAALQRAFPGVRHSVIGSDSRSGVPDQPYGDAETLQGALNRLDSIRCLPQHRGCLLVAVEGGVGFVDEAVAVSAADESSACLECFAWVVVQAPGGAVSRARSASFLLPPAVSRLMLPPGRGLELGAADDAVFGRTRSGQGSGTIGQLTGGLLTRQAYYEHATLCALIPLLNPELYPGVLPAGAAGEGAGEAGAEP